MKLVYADEYRQRHKLGGQFSSDLDALCRKDYHREFFNQEIKCLDLDTYEKTLRSGQIDRTMDAAVGIANYENNRVTQCRFLLMELKLGSTKPSNLSFDNLSQKIAHTRDILSDSDIHPEYYFIFTQNVAPVARSLFNRNSRQSKNVKSWIAMSPDDFMKAMIPIEYVPMERIEEIPDGLLKSSKKGEDSFFNFYQYWAQKIDEYWLKHNLNEARAIYEKLLHSLNAQESVNTGIDNLKTYAIEDLNLKKQKIHQIVT